MRWVERVHERGSGYVHLSAVHLSYAVMPDDAHVDPGFTRIEIRVSGEQCPVPEWLRTALVDSDCSITEMLFDLVSGRTQWKDRPATGAAGQARHQMPCGFSALRAIQSELRSCTCTRWAQQGAIWTEQRLRLPRHVMSLDSRCQGRLV